jgi:hypothetical protein
MVHIKINFGNCNDPIFERTITAVIGKVYQLKDIFLIIYKLIISNNY